MQKPPLTRRDMLMKCAALGFLSVASQFSLAVALDAWERNAQNRTLSPTPWCGIGPFYKRRAPHTARLRAPGDPGLPLVVSGQVVGMDATAIPDASIEIWQTDHLGHYDVAGFRYRATLIANSSGDYSFESVMPGHYPDRVCQHIHYVIVAPGYRTLITQLYFATDPVFDGNPDKNYTRDHVITSRELVRPVSLTGDPKDMHAAVSFPIVLERL